MDTLSAFTEGERIGHMTPRIYSAPLVGGAPGPCGCGCALDEDTSYGFDVAWFAENVVGMPLDPWQRWLVIHAGEVMPNGHPRFRRVLVLVARQQGKTHLLKILTLYWLFVERHGLVLGMSTNLSYAIEAWQGACEIARSVEWIDNEVERVILRNAEQALVTKPRHDTRGRVIPNSRRRYKIAAANAKGGRSLSIDRLVIDELREHHDWHAYNAAVPAMNARRNGQGWFITNQGEDRSIVLDALRTAALDHIAHRKGDDRLGIFEWSAPDGADPEDLDALACANPDLGGRTDPYVLLGAARTAKAAGGLELSGFRTEYMCQRVHLLDPAIEPEAWRAAGTDEPLSLAEHRPAVALCLDVSLDGSHASAIVVGIVDGHAHAEVVGSWAGLGCTQVVRQELPGLVARIKPAVLGWLPNGPAAVLTADLGRRKGRQWPPRNVKLVEITGEITAVCMSLAEQVLTENITHPNDPMLDVHVAAAARQWRGDAWVFARGGAGPIDGAYALAGALHLARTLRVRPKLTAV